MTIQIRPATASEMGQLGELTSYGYGGAFGDGPDNIPATSIRAEWTLCAFDGPRMVASFATIPFTMRANGNAMAMGGVSTVVTIPEYRRQGLLRRLMTDSFEHMRERKQPVASLWASQAAIYQRYQYAQATQLRHYTIDTVDIVFHDGNWGTGTVARTSITEGLDDLRDLYRSYVADGTCYLHRAQVRWSTNLFETTAADGPPEIAIARDEDGVPVGYVIYTLRSARVNHPSRNQEIKIRDLVWLTADAYRRLWHFIAQHDLVGRVVWTSAPIDDPAPDLFTEPRLLNCQDKEGTWLRIVDVAGALAGRGYTQNGKLRISLPQDKMTPWNAGTWELDASPEGATVKPSDKNPDISLSLKSLASLFCGMRSAHDLARAGMIEGNQQAIEGAHKVFATQAKPHCPDHF
ncbi:MAG: GNAT family N-acetyltransferase [Proteobacteria bacterium]|nr:GNAT family N-acetyltransferase [Pseudomonadota bacterium]